VRVVARRVIRPGVAGSLALDGRRLILQPGGGGIAEVFAGLPGVRQYLHRPILSHAGRVESATAEADRNE